MRIKLSDEVHALVRPMHERATQGRMLQEHGVAMEYEALQQLWKCIRQHYPETDIKEPLIYSDKTGEVLSADEDCKSTDL